MGNSTLREVEIHNQSNQDIDCRFYAGERLYFMSYAYTVDKGSSRTEFIPESVFRIIHNTHNSRDDPGWQLTFDPNLNKVDWWEWKGRDLCFFLDRTSDRWKHLIISHPRKKLLLRNESNETISVIMKDKTKVVAARSYKEFLEFEDIATCLGKKLEVRKISFDSEKLEIHLPRKIQIDGLIIECVDDCQNQTVTVVVKEESGG